MISYIDHIHFDDKVERAIIGVCLNSGSRAFAEARTVVSSEHFHVGINKIMFEVMEELWLKGYGIDNVTTSAFIYKNGLEKNFTESAAYAVAMYQQEVVNDANFLNWVFLLREMFIERQLLIIQSKASSGQGDAIEKMINLQKQIEKALAVRAVDDWQDMSKVMMLVQEHQSTVRGKTMNGLPTGFKTLDKITFGLQPGDTTLIGARPSVGKSAFAAAIALNAAREGNKLGIITLEMSNIQFGARMISQYTNTEFWRVYRNKFESEAKEAQLYRQQAEMSGLPIWISDKTNVNTGDIRAKVTKLHDRIGGLDGVIIDYIQLIEGDTRNDNREREVAKISRGLKLLAMELKIPIIILAQLNKDSEKAQDKKPKLSNIRESDTLGQDASNVFLLHRDFKAGIVLNEKGDSTEREATIIVEKNRNGECMQVPISFDPDTMKFYEQEGQQGNVFQSHKTVATTATALALSNQHLDAKRELEDKPPVAEEEQPY